MNTIIPKKRHVIPFKRARIMAAQIAMAHSESAKRAALLADIGEYRSRGKGRGLPQRNWMARAGINIRVGRKLNRTQECERRLRQMGR